MWNKIKNNFLTPYDDELVNMSMKSYVKVRFLSDK